MCCTKLRHCILRFLSCSDINCGIKEKKIFFTVVNGTGNHCVCVCDNSLGAFKCERSINVKKEAYFFWLTFWLTSNRSQIVQAPQRKKLRTLLAVKIKRNSHRDWTRNQNGRLILFFLNDRKTYIFEIFFLKTFLYCKYVLKMINPINLYNFSNILDEVLFHYSLVTSWIIHNFVWKIVEIFWNCPKGEKLMKPRIFSKIG